MVVVLFTRSCTRGRVLVGDDVDENERKMGWLPEGFVRLLSPVAVVGPRSYSSQLNVTASPSGSEPVAVNSMGVEMGTTSPSVPALTVGKLFPVGVFTEHVFPVPIHCERNHFVDAVVVEMVVGIALQVGCANPRVPHDGRGRTWFVGGRRRAVAAVVLGVVSTVLVAHLVRHVIHVKRIAHGDPWPVTPPALLLPHGDCKYATPPPPVENTCPMS